MQFLFYPHLDSATEFFQYPAWSLQGLVPGGISQGTGEKYDPYGAGSCGADPEIIRFYVRGSVSLLKCLFPENKQEKHGFLFAVLPKKCYT